MVTEELQLEKEARQKAKENEELYRKHSEDLVSML